MMAKNTAFSQLTYPMMKIIKGDSIVLMTKKQADEINTIFSKQRSKIQKLQTELEIAEYKKDSVEWLMLDQDNWIDYAILQMREDSIENSKNLEVVNRLSELKYSIVNYNNVTNQLETYQLGNLSISTNRKGEKIIKPEKYLERSDWFAALFTVLTITNVIIFFN